MLKPDATKSSVFSLMSTATAITVKRNMAKKKVVRNFLSMYQSSFFTVRSLSHSVSNSIMRCASKVK